MDSAITIIEDLRTKIGSQELRASYFATVQNKYELYIDLLMQLHQQNPNQGYDALALHASERARARSLGEDRSYLWAVTKTSITSYVLPKRSEIEAAAQTFRESLTPNSAANLETGLPLSQMLLAPVANQLGNKRLLVVGDGALQSVPFAALPIPGNIKMSVSHSSHRDINDSEGFSFLLSPRPEINDTVGELRKGHTPLKINVDVGAKHSGDQFCYSTKIFVSECFALPPS